MPHYYLGCALYDQGDFESAARHFKIADVSALYAAVGESNLGAQSVVRKVIELHGGDEGAQEDLAEAVTITGRGRSRRPSSGDAGVMVTGQPDVWVKLAKCCTPVPPDSILGFVTKGGGVSVHRKDCTNAESLLGQPEKLVDVEWAPTGQSTFLVNIQVEALDRARLLSDITKVLSDVHVNILAASLATTRDRIAKSRFTFEMADPKHLGHVLKAVRSVDGVFDAYRVIPAGGSCSVTVNVTSAAAEEWTSQGVPKSLLIQKPFAPAQITTAVSQLLNSADVVPAPNPS